LPAGTTAFKYTTDICPAEGFYTVVRRTSLAGCFGNTWQSVTSDHTYTDDNGNMMIVNDTTTPYNKILFSDTIKKATCSNNMYEFTAAILNIDLPNYCSNGTARNPGFIFSVQKYDNIHSTGQSCARRFVTHRKNRIIPVYSYYPFVKKLTLHNVWPH